MDDATQWSPSPPTTKTPKSKVGRRRRGKTANGQDAIKEYKPPKVGAVIMSGTQSFTIEEMIGSGSYGQVFRVSSSVTERRMALKAEVHPRAVLRLEIMVLKIAGSRRCQHICELVDYGRISKQFKYVVMTLLGPDLYKLRRDRISECFSIHTSVRVGIQTLQAIEELHGCGFISRDIKPSNFAIGNAKDGLARKIFIFDFGLAKKYIKHGVLLPSRGQSGWRGTSRYASVMTHRKMDQGRRDDLESWLYMLIEFCNGMLPWQHLRNRDETLKMKLSSRTSQRDLLLTNCPTQFAGFLAQVDLLLFESTPDYNNFYTVLGDILQQSRLDANGPYDWEVDEEFGSTDTVSSERPDMTTKMMVSEWPTREAALPGVAKKTPKGRTGQMITTQGRSVAHITTATENTAAPLNTASGSTASRLTSTQGTTVPPLITTALPTSQLISVDAPK